LALHYKILHVANLTYSSDKLVALSGIAKAVQQINKDQYLAGMWRRGLESTLCWRIGAPGVDDPFELDRPHEERAPSWSWASVDGEIHVLSPGPNDEHLNEELHIKVVNVSVELKGDDCFGQVQGGILELECKAVLRGFIGMEDTWAYRENAVAIGKSTVYLKFHWDCREYVSTGLHFFIPVGSDWLASKYFDHISRIIVRPTRDRQGQYRRVGHFRTCYELHGHSKENLEREMQEFNNGGAAEVTDFVEIVYDENGSKRYVVEII
jgi:hypothetical protein